MAVEPKDAPVRDLKVLRSYRRAGIAILAAGLAAAAVAYVRASAAAPEADPYLIAPDQTKVYDLQMERLGGQANVMGAEFQQWLGSLWHGRRLAGTLAVLSVAGCLGCFYLGDLLSVPLPPDDRGGDPDGGAGEDR
jgi:hypothetical protein